MIYNGQYFNPYGSTVSNSHSWIAGAVGHWDPVKNLDFELELLYQDTHTDQPAGFNGGNNPANGGYETSMAGSRSTFATRAANYTGKGAYGQNCNWERNSSGFAARFEITRNF